MAPPPLPRSPNSGAHRILPSRTESEHLYHSAPYWAPGGVSDRQPGFLGGSESFEGLKCFRISMAIIIGDWCVGVAVGIVVKSNARQCLMYSISQ